MTQIYGEPLFSIPVDLDFGCPNRQMDGSGGCSFCPQNGARAAQIADASSVEEQIEKGIAFAKRRYKAKNFSLYIQAYTGTFASVLEQREAYEKLLKCYPFKALHVGTRPDCLNEATLLFLQELGKTITVYVELGVQSAQDETLVRINRGHSFAKSKEAIENLQKHGIKTYAHIIVGLPGETRVHWLHTVRELVKLGIDGLKIHHLHVIKNTQLADAYEKQPFKTFSEYEYAEELIELLRYIPSHIPILRIATDTPDKDLIAQFGICTKVNLENTLHKQCVTEVSDRAIYLKIAFKKVMKYKIKLSQKMEVRLFGIKTIKTTTTQEQER